jgi:hypothetical protein
LKLVIGPLVHAASYEHVVLAEIEALPPTVWVSYVKVHLVQGIINGVLLRSSLLGSSRQVHHQLACWHQLVAGQKPYFDNVLTMLQPCKSRAFKTSAISFSIADALQLFASNHVCRPTAGRAQVARPAASVR